MTTTTRTYLADLFEHVATTGGATGGGLAICHATGIPLMYAAPIAVALALVKGVFARYVGSPASSSIVNTNVPDEAARQAQAYDLASAVFAFLQRFLQHQIAVSMSTSAPVIISSDKGAPPSPPITDTPQPAAVSAHVVDDSLPSPGV